jgi:carbamoyl-phosphate synthase/aspartate carbamoyltransferase
LQRTVAAPVSAALVPSSPADEEEELVEHDADEWKSSFAQIEWLDPNKKNLVAEGNNTCSHVE